MTAPNAKPRAGEHTAWSVSFGDSEAFIHAGELDVAHVYDAENARRIVACVNACEGIKTENLEHASLDFGKELRADLDEALDALTLLDQAENGPWDGEEQKRHLRTAWKNVARALLAKHGR